MKIAIDLDDVTVEFFSNVLECVDKEYGVRIPYESITDWDRNPLKELRVFGDERSWWDWLRDRDWLWAQFPAVDGAIGGIDTLRREGHSVEALTSKPDWARWCVWSWLGKWRPNFDRVTIVPMGEPKTDWTDAEVLVDDAIHNHEAWAGAGRTGILFTRPWNTDDERFIRADDWQEVVSHIRDLAGGSPT